MDIPVESFSGEELCRVSKDMSDEEVKTQIKSKLGITSCIELFRHDDVVMYGIMDDRSILLKMPFAEKLGWSTDVPCHEWQRCTFGGSEGTSLTSLALALLNLTELPSELGNLTNLQSLWCGNNRLTALPSELGQLTNLQGLWCSYNGLTELPSELGNLTNLQSLWCTYNDLTEEFGLPSEILALKDHGCEIYQ